jgi:hypothetical protein
LLGLFLVHELLSSFNRAPNVPYSLSMYGKLIKRELREVLS